LLRFGEATALISTAAAVSRSYRRTDTRLWSAIFLLSPLARRDRGRDRDSTLKEIKVPILQRLKFFGIDTYMLLLLATVLLAIVLPVSGEMARVVKTMSMLGVALLFFLYGAKLNTSAVIAGLSNWRLQALVFGCTYLVFPLIALAITAVLAGVLDPGIALGVMFLGVLPSTVQSSIAFTALARGNVAAAVCAASISNLVGVVLTPVLCGLLLHASGEINPDAILGVAMQILLPFVLGQALRRWIGPWVARNRGLTLAVDRGSILLIVYSAFSAGMVARIWTQISTSSLILIVVVAVVMLALVAFGSLRAARWSGLPRGDAMALLFCGSTKSLASGIPMANLLFAADMVGIVILPLMLFHQLQLITCAVVAQRHSVLQELAAAREQAA
jgi:sodium/bile acid cotransporter 7